MANEKLLEHLLRLEGEDRVRAAGEALAGLARRDPLAAKALAEELERRLRRATAARAPGITWEKLSGRIVRDLLQRPAPKK